MDFSENEFDEVLNIFRNEGLEILESMDGNLLLLEKDPENNELVLQLFRGAHSLKGSARMLGFNGIQSLAHKIEDILDLFKKNKLFPKPEILEIITETLECVKELIEKTVENRAEYTTPDIAEHITKLEDIMTGRQEPLYEGFYETQEPEDDLIEMVNISDIDDMPDTDELIDNIKKLETNIEVLPKVKNLILQSVKSLGGTSKAKVFRSFANLLQIYEESNKPFERDTLAAICDIINDFSELDLYDDVERRRQLDSLIQRADIVEKISQINIKVAPQKPVGSVTQSFNSQDWFDNMNTSAIKTLRIDSTKLDQLVNQIGELIVTKIKNTEQLQYMRGIQNEFIEWQKNWNKFGHFLKYFDKKYLSNNFENGDFQNITTYNKQLIALHNTHTEKLAITYSKIDTHYKRLQENDTQLDSITSDLETMVKNMRVLPLATIFHLFPRMVHNIAKDKGKEIDFKVRGSEVSADKKIIEDIKIPLMHILRNSIDHGIEDPDVREEKGKKRTGEISIIAEHRENKIIITVEDDGCGLDVEKIRARALECGFLSAEEANTLSEDQIVNLIFYPGFSTGETVTELSGRGLGLDIVHTKISQLNGRIDVCSEYGNGTTITIELPATMATIKAFIVLEFDQMFAIPASSIKTVTRINTNEVFDRDGKNYFIYNEKIIPIFTLSQILRYENLERKTEKYTLLLIESDNAQIGIIVDKLIGEEEILHKKLPLPFLKIKNISGITTLANGKASLVLNVGDMLNTAVTRKSITKIVAMNRMVVMDKNKEYRILVVDDSVTTRTLQKNIIERYGYRVQIATNAFDGLNLLKNETFDLIVTDNEMPEMNGLDFVREVKKDTRLSKIPIVVVTSSEKSLWFEQFAEVGADSYMQKSEFNQDTFIQKINELIKK